ncbi:MAG TPA: hypothetical protein ENN06_05920 [Desulfobacteraceae bacterium]|nr:hypothetical protein [Desulfobacteraceae bacterium]
MPAESDQRQPPTFSGQTMRKYAFIYFLGEDIDTIRNSLGQHVRYWKGLGLDYYVNGPFADRSGGLIVFSSDSPEKAGKIIAQDPLVKAGAVGQYWLKEWVA